VTNPFLAPSALPYGLPDFAAITDDHYLPAFEAGMAEQRTEVDALLASGEPTFANTVEALELSGRILDRVSRVFFSRAGADTTPRIEEVRAAVAPMLAAHADEISLDPRLFARISAVHADREGLDPESRRLAERYYTDAVRAGAQLSDPDKERLKALNAELSSLSTTFSTRLLSGANAAAVHVHDVAKLDGMSPGAISAAAAAATSRGHESGFLLTLILPTAQPVLESLRDRDLRREVFETSVGRGVGGEFDTRETVLRITALRAERARLLGYPTHAAYVIEDSTAGSVDAVAAMLADLAPPAMRNADAEALDLAGSGVLEPWDWTFEAERVRRERFEIDAALLRPYLELESVLTHGVFHAAEELYGIQLHPRHDLVGYHPDVRFWEVFDADGTPLGLFGGDYYARESKRGGAWMNALVGQSSLLDEKPVVMNTLNITKPAPGEPTLLTIDEVRTLFHEFGHALHGLFSAVRYPTFSGTSVPRDFVEFPSQVNEMWLERPEILARYARHWETGESLPPELLGKLLASRAYGEGFRTTEYLAASLLDQAWHTLTVDDTVEDVETFEAEALRKAGIAHPLVPPRYRSTYFNHVFAGGYSAGYYSYIWSEVLDADTVRWFEENGGLKRENGDHFRRELLSKGGSVEAMEAYRAFRGRDPEIQPLLERRNLT